MKLLMSYLLVEPHSGLLLLVEGVLAVDLVCGRGLGHWIFGDNTINILVSNVVLVFGKVLQ